MSLIAIVVIWSAIETAAQTPTTFRPVAAAQPAWSFRAALASYQLPDEDDYLQPTLVATRGALHVESRYNYEGRRSISGFLGWHVAAGSRITVEFTPLLGAVMGDTDGVIPAVSLAVGLRRLEFYTEGEYVIDLGSSDDSFLYNWSEFSVWATDWLRAGAVAQRTRVLQQPREIQRGVLIGIAIRRAEATVYVFNPGADDYYVVTSVGVSF